MGRAANFSTMLSSALKMSASKEHGRCRPRSGWNWAWRILREHENIVSGCEVNRLIAGLYGECLPSIDLAHVDLSRGKQRPEQHGCGVCRRQHGLRLDPSLELFVQPLDCIGGAHAARSEERRV